MVKINLERWLRLKNKYKILDLNRAKLTSKIVIIMFIFTTVFCFGILSASADELVVYPSGDTTGVTDSSNLQSALNTGGNIILAPGDFYINKRLVIMRHKTSIIAHDATVSQITSGMGILRSRTDDTAFEYKGLVGFYLEGGTWKTNAEVPSGSYSVFNISHAEDIEINSATFLDIRQGHMIEFAGVKNGRIVGCTFGGKYGSPDRNKEAIQLDTTHSEAMVGKMSHYDDTYCQNILIEGNTIDFPRGVGSHGVVKDHLHKDITVRNNVINADVGGVAFLSVRNLLVEKNTISGAKIGVEFNTRSVGGYSGAVNPNPTSTIPLSKAENGKYGIEIKSNEIKGGSMYGIKVYGTEASPLSNVDISSNKVSNTGAAGIVLYYGKSSPKISKNTITNPKGSGIYAQNCEKSVITGNTVKSATKNGIGLSSGSGQIKDNKISGTKNNGVYVQSASGVTVSKNNITSSSADGILISSSKSDVTNNTIKKSKKNGITLDKAAKTKLQDNTIEGGVNGISVTSSSTAANVLENDISDVSENGISLVSSKDVVLKQNKIEDTGKYGIQILEKATNATVEKNSIIGTKSSGIYVLGKLIEKSPSSSKKEMAPITPDQPEEPPIVMVMDVLCDDLMLANNTLEKTGGIVAKYYTHVRIEGNKLKMSNKDICAIKILDEITGNVAKNTIEGNCSKIVQASDAPNSINLPDVASLSVSSPKSGAKSIKGTGDKKATITLTVNKTSYKVKRDGKDFSSTIKALKKGDVVKVTQKDKAGNSHIITTTIK